ncbi:MAG: response regulator [Ignavibacteriales bacterium]|nr:response regulator [Ignavibacteriales bacterium]
MLRVLILEDSPQDVEIIRELLIDAGFDLDMDCTALEKEFVSLLRSNTYDVILADFKLPGFDGFSALRWAKEICPNVPFICVSGAIGEETAVEFLKLGAVDYVLKDRPKRLPFAIKRALVEAKEKETKRQAEQQVKKLNRVYSVLSNINQAIVRIHDTNQLIKDACMITVDEGKFQSAWIGIVNNETKKIETSATAGLANNLIEVSPKQNPIVNALKSGKHFVSNNINGDENITDIWKQNSVSLGFRSFTVFPLIVLGKVIGVFCIYSNEIDFFDSQEISLLDEMATDISFAFEFIQKEADRKRVEEALIEKEERYQSLIQTSLDGFWVADAQGHLLEVNDAYCLMTGYSKEKLLTMNISDLECAETQENTREHIKKIISTGHDRFESKHIRADGKIIDVEINTVYLNSKSIFLVFTNDITERKRAEEVLKMERQRLFDVLESIPVMVCLLTPDYHVIFSNSAFRTMFGEGNGRFCYDYIFGNEKPCVFCETFNVLKTGKPHHWCCKNRDGSRIIDVFDFPFTDTDGSPLVLEMDIDITDRIRAENELITTNKELTFQNEEKEKRAEELVIANKVLDFENKEKEKQADELIVAKEKAEELNRLKSCFLANMSHELRTPLIGILGFAEILKEELTDENFREQAELIFDGGTRLKKTLNLILDLSKIEAESLTVNLEEIELTSYIPNLVKVFEKSAESKGIELKLITGEELLFSNLDKALLDSINNNLVNNAIKYTHQGKVTVEINKIIDNEKLYAELLVADSGIGIAEENLAIIFEPFRQASEGWSRNYEGTGLGLTLVKKYVASMKGTISVESKVGVGSTFKVRLPITKSVFKESEKADNGTKEETYVIETERINKPLILYVEDDIVSQQVIKAMVSNYYRIEHIAEGEGAIELVKQKKYDIILMDINLKGKLNGLETAKEIKKIEGYERTSIIAVTAYAMAGEKEKLLSGGCTYYISKPFLKDEFLSLLSESLNR